METSGKNNQERVAQSMKAAVSMSGYSLDSIKRAKKAGCKAFRGSRVYLDLLDEFFVQNSELLGLSPTERMIFEREANKKEKAKFELDLVRGDYIHRDEITEAARETTALLKSTLKRFLYNELPAKGEFQDRAALRDLCGEAYREMCQLQQEGFSKWIVD